MKNKTNTTRILPIIFYGDPILRKKCSEINFQYSSCKRKKINQLIKNMFKTVRKVKGIGLSAPQIGKSIRLFIVDIPFFNEKKKIKKYKEVFINAKIKKIYGKEYNLNEGCLSIPGILGKIKRKSNISIEYYNQYWEKKTKKLSGIFSRVILHEYDHLDGKLFIDYFSIKKRKLIEKKLIFFFKKKKQ